MIVDTDAAIRFLRTAYEPDDWIALFLKSYETGQTLQRVGPLSLFLEPRVHAWLRAMNARRFNCYVGVNSIKHGRSVAHQGRDRHRPSRLHRDRQRRSTAPGDARRPPRPADAVVRHRILAEPSARLLARQRVHDRSRRAAPEVPGARVGHRHRGDVLLADDSSAGYRNHKRTPAALVTIQYGRNDVRHTPLEFPAPPEPLPSQPMSPVERSRTSVDVRGARPPIPGTRGACNRRPARRRAHVSRLLSNRAGLRARRCGRFRGVKRVECAVRAAMERERAHRQDCARPQVWSGTHGTSGGRDASQCVGLVGPPEQADPRDPRADG